MTINKKITNEKPQHVISREKLKVSALSSGKVDKYILYVKRYCLLVLVKRLNKLRLLILR